jgi:hypothetical protein
MARLTAEQLKALNVVFDEFALKDQTNYYQRTVERNRKAAAQVNLARALASFVTGFSAAAAGLTVQSVFLGQTRCAPIVQAGSESYCMVMSGVILLAAVVAVVAPAIGSAFSTLADLYQWDRLNTVYENALYTLKVADAYSPLDEMGEVEYRAGLMAFAQGTLNVMHDEAAQWGQLVRQPEAVSEYLAAAQARAAQVQSGVAGGAGQSQGGGTGG